MARVTCIYHTGYDIRDEWDGWPVYLGTMAFVFVTRFMCSCVGCFGYFGYCNRGGGRDRVIRSRCALHKVVFFLFFFRKALYSWDRWLSVLEEGPNLMFWQSV